MNKWGWTALITLLLIAGVLAWYFNRSIAGKFTLPVNDKITSPFGDRDQPTAGASTDHKGIDIRAAIGTEVFAPADGEITYIGNTVKGGKEMQITHAGGWKTEYLHLSTRIASVGEKVKHNQVIALTGNSGNTSGPHLHWGVLDPLGNRVDPEQHLA